MTVENTSNRQTAQQMGTSFEYQFTFDVLLKDPTSTEAMQAIKAIVADEDGNETELQYGTDYTVTLNSDRSGGHITVVDKRTSTDYITIYREHNLKQEADYQDFNSMPAETFEQCFDKLTMLAQQLNEAINRCVKVAMTSSVDPEVFAAKVERIYESADNIDIVAGIEDDVETVADNNTNITTVAEISEDVTDVASISDKVPTVADDKTNIDTLANNIADVNTCATNIADIISAALNAALAKQYAIGEPTEPDGHSAKYWAEQAAGGQVQSDWDEDDSSEKAYILNKPRIKTWTATVSTTWTGDTAPFTQAITLAGLLATDNVQIALIPTDAADFVATKAEQKELGRIYAGVTSANTLTLYAKSATTSAISIVVWEVQK